MLHIETGRLIIRSLQHADAPMLAELWSDPDVTRFMGGPRDYNQVRETLEQDAAGPALTFDLWPVVEKDSGRIIGHCGLLDKEVEGQVEIELVYVFHPAVWGKGYATEAGAAIRDYAFTSLRPTRLIALVDPDNTASAQVARTLGFQLEKETRRPGGKVMQLYALPAPNLAVSS